VMRKTLFVLMGATIMLNLAFLTSVVHADIQPKGVTRYATLPSPFSYATVSMLNNLQDRDQYILNVTKKTKLFLFAVDLGLIGDTLAIFSPTPNTPVATAKSPACISVSGLILNPGTYMFYVGYTAHPNPFPDGYFIYLAGLPA